MRLVLKSLLVVQMIIVVLMAADSATSGIIEDFEAIVKKSLEIKAKKCGGGYFGLFQDAEMTIAMGWYNAYRSGKLPPDLAMLDTYIKMTGDAINYKCVNESE